MTEWDGKCSICGVQIDGNPNEELHYDLDEYPAPAYCKTCWDMKEKQRRQFALQFLGLSSLILVVCFILLKVLGCI
jgi:hypothetical protein